MPSPKEDSLLCPVLLAFLTSFSPVTPCLPEVPASRASRGHKGTDLSPLSCPLPLGVSATLACGRLTSVMALGSWSPKQASAIKAHSKGTRWP